MPGPISSARPGGARILVETVVLLLCMLIFADWVREHKRQSGLRNMATRRGFVYLGSSLPRSFTLRGTRLEAATSVWNVIDADCGGIRVVCFDCRVGTGKSSWRRTAIAAEGPPDIFGTRLTADLTVDQCGEWSIMYEPKRMFLIPGRPMAVSEIEAHLAAIGC